MQHYKRSWAKVTHTPKYEVEHIIREYYKINTKVSCFKVHFNNANSQQNLQL